jgi:hypothetical protein
MYQRRFTIIIKVTLLPGLVALTMIWLFFQVAQAGQASGAHAAGETAVAGNPAPLASLAQPDHLQVLSATAQAMVVELTVPGFSAQTSSAEGQPCQVLSVPGFAESADPGRPRLPLRGALLGIPPDVSLQLEVIESELTALPGRYRLCPVETPNVTWEAGRDGPPDILGYQRLYDEAFYATDQFSPAEPAQLASTGFVRSQRVASLRFQPFQYNPVTGELRYYSRIRLRVSFLGGSSRERRAMTQVDEGAFEASLRQTLVNYDRARTWRVAPGNESQRTRLPEALAEDGRAFKLLVDQDGLYRVTYDDLQAAGFPLEGLISSSLRLHNRGQEVALYVAGEQDDEFNPGDYFLFYGQNPRSKYTNTNVYWLTWNEGAPGLHMQERDGAPDQVLPVSAGFTRTVHLEENLLYRSAQVSGPDLDRWYWRILPDPVSGATRTSFQVSLDQVSSEPASATIKGLFKSFSATPRHHTQVLVNNHLVYDAYWPSLAQHSFSARFPQAYLIEGTNVITVAQPRDAPITADTLFINWLELDYTRMYTATNDEIQFLGQAGEREYQLGGVSADSLQIFDITTPERPVRISGAEVQLVGAAYQARLQQNLAGEGRFLALSQDRLRTPSQIFEDASSDLHSSLNGADYILIAHPDFYEAVQPLADYRHSQGLRVKRVDVQDVYDEFGAGLPDPEAIRSFLAYAYTNWQAPAPAYVVLVGDGNVDPKNYQGFSPPSYIPPYLADVDDLLGETAADNRYVSVSGSDILPDMHLGRLPVRSAAEARMMVDRLLAYEQNPPAGDWVQKVMFVADDNDTNHDFGDYSNQIANYHLPPPYTPDKIYYLETHTTAISARQAITEGLNQGRLVVSYVGHAGFQRWAGTPTLFGLPDIGKLTNADRLPFMVPMTCLEGYYIWSPDPAQVPDSSSLAEALVRTPGKGAIASFSPTGSGVAEGHDRLESGLFDAIFEDHVVELGPATTQAKLDLYAQTTAYPKLIETFLLFGDPATRLNVIYQILLPIVNR